MPKSFQKEKPPARVNLFLEVEKNGAQEKVELPLRMLMLGDYKGREDATPLADREIVNVTGNNFDAVMKSMDLTVETVVPDTIRGGDEEMKVELAFDDLNDFHPEQVAKQVPQLTKMLAMRNLLQDLRNRVVSMGDFRRQLEAIIQDEESLAKLTEELDQFVKPSAAAEAADGAPDEAPTE